MDEEKLQQILELKDAQAIDRELVKEGFFDMAKHPTLKKVSLVPIAQSKNLIRLDWINDYKYSFQANYVYLATNQQIQQAIRYGRTTYSKSVRKEEKVKWIIGGNFALFVKSVNI